LIFARNFVNYWKEIWHKGCGREEFRLEVRNDTCQKSQIWRWSKTAFDTKNVLDPVKSGYENVTVWERLSCNKFGKLANIHDTYKCEQYVNLKEVVFEILKLSYDYIFQPDCKIFSIVWKRPNNFLRKCTFNNG